MYACSPHWNDDWISIQDAEKILTQLKDSIQASPHGPDKVGINSGLHLTGGEPFLNFNLLLKLTEMIKDYKIPSTFVETNCFWCGNDKETREKLSQLKDAGLNGILISVNPFILEQVPYERTERAIKISKEIFRENVMIYQELYEQIFKMLKIKNTLFFEDFMRLAPDSLRYVELIPMGRATYELAFLYKKSPAKEFFGMSCKNELTRDWHVHVDNYCNYMTGYCGGISLGDARDLNPLLNDLKLEEKPILQALFSDLQDLYRIGVNQFGYEEIDKGYVSKCHLCIDIRRHIVQQTDEFKELSPRQLYDFIE